MSTSSIDYRPKASILAPAITLSDEVNAAVRLSLTTLVIGVLSSVTVLEKGAGEERAPILFEIEHNRLISSS